MRIRDLLDIRAVNLDSSPYTKTETINHLVDLLAKSGCLNDPDRYCRAVFERESKGSTGLGDGVAIPHAKSAGVNTLGLAAMVVRSGVDFDSIDGEKAYLFFMIASPHKATDEHIDVLAHLSSLLIDETFRKKLIESQTPEEFMQAIDSAENSIEEEQTSEIVSLQSEHLSSARSSGYDVVAVTACPAGLSHTYMAAEAIEHKAREMGISIKVEADGAAGNRNRLLPEDIANAKAVIVAADRAVDMDRFIGKPLVRVGVVDGIRKPEELIKKALSPTCPQYRVGGQATENSSVLMRLYRHLMSGLTYIMPLAATAGILSAIARFDFIKTTSLGMFLDTIGYSIGTLLFPVLSAFISFSIGGRTALVAGFTGGVMADMANTGVVGAVVNGFVGGGVAFLSSRFALRFLKGHDAMFALLVYPLLGALGTTLVAQFVTNIPSGFVDELIDIYLGQADPLVLVILGGILGGMMSADMGGPFNKMSYAIGVLLLADCLPEIGCGSYVMAAVMAGGMTPPIAAGVAAGILCRPLFSEKEKKIAFKTISKGFLFITEGVFPYLAVAPVKMRFVCVLSSAAAGALSMACSCAVCAPHGGIFVIPLAVNPLDYLMSILAGSLLGAVLFVIMRATVRNKPAPTSSHD